MLFLKCFTEKKPFPVEKYIPPYIENGEGRIVTNPAYEAANFELAAIQTPNA